MSDAENKGTEPLNNAEGDVKDAPQTEASQPVTAPVTPAPQASPSTTPAPEKPAATPASSEPKKNRKPLIIGIIAAIVVIVIIVLAVVFIGGNQFYDNTAQGGQAPYKTEEEVQAELNRTVEDGMLNISIASKIEFQNGTSEGTAYIENVPSNKYVMKVTITLDSNDEVVYQSGGIKPDSFIEKIKLTKDLPAGTYPATATFAAFDPETLQEVGQAAAKITLVVNE